MKRKNQGKNTKRIDPADYIDYSYNIQTHNYNWFADLNLGSSDIFKYRHKDNKTNNEHVFTIKINDYSLNQNGQANWVQDRIPFNINKIRKEKFNQEAIEYDFALGSSNTNDGFMGGFIQNHNYIGNLFGVRLVLEPYIPASYSINFDRNFENATGETPQKDLSEGETFKIETPNYKSPKAFIIGYYKTDSKALSKAEKDMLSNLTVEDLNKPKEELLKKNIYKKDQSYDFNEIFNKLGIKPGDSVTMHAIWQEINKDLTFKNGEVKFFLRHGDSVSFNGLPAHANYEIYEKTEAGWVLVKAENDKGRIIPNGDIESIFTNNYEPNVAYAQFHGAKTVDNESTNSKDYEFEIYEGGSITTDGKIQNGKLLETVKSDSNGHFTFGEFSYDNNGKISKALFKYTKGNKENENNDLGDLKEKTFTYYVREKTASTESIKKDKTIYKITILVTDDGAGNLKADSSIIKAFDGQKISNVKSENIRFNNEKVKESLKIIKKISVDESNNIDINDLSSEFKVKVKLSNEPEERTIILKKNQDEDYQAIINDLLPGTKYKIIESDIPTGYKILSYKDIGGDTINIKDNNNQGINGEIKITKDVNDNPKTTGLINKKEIENKVIITNGYSSEGILNFSMNKELIGREMKNEEFEFALYDESEKTLIAKSKNSRAYNGENSDELEKGYNTVSFNGIPLNKVGKNTFIIKELETSDKTIIFDKTKFKIEVVATDDGSGKLIPEKDQETGNDKISIFKEQNGKWLSVSKDNAKFTNILKPGTLTIKKLVDNTITDNTFTLKLSLQDKDGKAINKKYAMKSNAHDKVEMVSDGSVFTIKNNETLTIADLPENTVYKIIETNLPEGYKLIKTDNTSGVIKSNEISSAVFTNSYLKGTYTIKGKKELVVPNGVSRRLKANEFKFLLLSENNEILDTVTNDENGNFSFNPINFTDEDYERYKNQDIVYKVMEDKGNDSNTIYDLSEFEVRLEIYKENGSIKVREKIRKNKLPEDSILFKNSHTEKLKLSIKKNVTGETNQDNIFKVKVSIKKPTDTDFVEKIVDIRNMQTIDFENLPEKTKVKIEEIKYGEEYSFNGFTINGKANKEKILELTLESNDNNPNGKNLTLVEIENIKNPTGSFNYKFYKRMNDGDYPSFNTFKFKITGPNLTDENDNPVDYVVRENDEFGNISIKFNFEEKDANTHRTYLIEEINDNQPLIGYDTTKYQLAFDVKKDQNNNLYADKVVITEKDGDQDKKIDDAVFNNTKTFFSFPVTGTTKTMIAFIIGIVGILLYILISKKRFVEKLK